MDTLIPHETISEFFDLLKHGWLSNFCFDNVFFEFPSEVGIPVGFFFGSLISKIMAKLERDLFVSPIGLLDHVVYWY